MDKNKSITVETRVNKDRSRVWELWTRPEHITGWNFAVEEWHSPKAENDLKEGGRFNFRMEAKDGSFGFDFTGTYNKVKPNEIIEYTMDDGRKVEILFSEDGSGTIVAETFEAENTNSVEMQRTGWQAILDNFKKYAEQQD